MPDFNRLKVFYFVSCESNFQKAADRLFITRSAVSQNIKNLEIELGFQLFYRDQQKVELTRAGQELLSTMRPFVEDLQATLESLETGHKLVSGHLRIGAPNDFGSNHLTLLIAKFRKKFPKVTFDLKLAIPPVQLEMLTKGELDLAFIDNADVHAEKYPVSLINVMKEKFVLTYARKFFSVPAKDVKYELIREFDFVDYVAHGPVTRMWFRSHFGKVPTDLKVVYSAESVQAVKNAVRLGLGFAALPEQLITHEVRSGELAILTANRKELINQIGLVRRLERPLVAREKAFVEFYRAEMAQLSH